KEPEPVPLDRPAERSTDVPGVVQGRRIQDAGGFLRRIDVVTLRPRAGSASKALTLEYVASRLGNDVQVDPARLHFAQSTGERELELGRVGRVHDVARHAAAVEGRSNIEAIDLHVPFVSTSTVAREDPH